MLLVGTKQQKTDEAMHMCMFSKSKAKNNSCFVFNSGSTLFDIGTSTGEITLKTGVTLDYSQFPLTLNVTAVDDGQDFKLTAETTVTIKKGMI